MSEVTRLIEALDHGESRDGATAAALLPLVYEELCRLAHQKMASQPPGQTIQATALVHEAYLKLVGGDSPRWNDRRHFFAAAAQAMRQILVDRARCKARQRHGGNLIRVDIDQIEVALPPGLEPETVLSLNEALEQLRKTDAIKAQVVEMKFFLGLQDGRDRRVTPRHDAHDRTLLGLCQGVALRANGRRGPAASKDLRDTGQGRKQVVGLDHETPLIRLELDRNLPKSGSGVTEEEIFLTAKELRPPDERAAYLDRVCADRRELRERVQRLLAAGESADGLFDRRDVAESLVDPAGAPSHSPTPGTGSWVGRYQLLEKIGEGGFGLVFMAEQREPVRRKVALKILKPGMDTAQIVARFEAERQALALMDHPNIAKVLDGGVVGAGAERSAISDQTSASTLTSALRPLTSGLGHPYFVMDLVRGVAITRFCEENKLSLQERLDLFLQACRAIQHAHRKGVIHRDIKPSNILVSLDYGEPTVKVIDFGVAKAIGPRLTERTLATQFAQMIGTPAYMSPEQAEMSNLDVDTRTDVYSQGILLHELLTGTTPFPEKELLSRGLDDMRRVIREEEPERPSARAGRRRSQITRDPRDGSSQPGEALRGDLDWIVLRAIEKDRRRRYDTPNERAADVQRYLNSEPVVARPPTALYRIGNLEQKLLGAADIHHRGVSPRIEESRAMRTGADGFRVLGSKA